MDGTFSLAMVRLFRKYFAHIVLCKQHVCADTMRSTAVLIAAILATTVSSIDGAVADSLAAIVVSIIIFVSILPLLRGLLITARQIQALKKNPPVDMIEV